MDNQKDMRRSKTPSAYDEGDSIIQKYKKSIKKLQDKISQLELECKENQNIKSILILKNE